MASLKQELRGCARGFAQFFRQRAFLRVVLPLLALFCGAVGTRCLGRRLDHTLAGSLCGRGYHQEGGCVADALLVEARIRVPEFALEMLAADFEAAGRVAAEPGKPLRSAGFWVDRWEAHEATRASGQRARRLSYGEAGAYCAAKGGRLPTSEEWVLLAAYPKRTRYPWGDTGLLCRTAAWGREAGPCAWNASQVAVPNSAADAPGAHPEGCSPAGLCDVVGNRAEWSDDGKLHGGSYASTFAGELRVWSVETPALGETPAYAGARCVYDAPP